MLFRGTVLPVICALFCLSPIAVSAVAADHNPITVAGKEMLPGLQLTLIAAKQSFAVGERIPITMRYVYTGTKPLSVELINYDRSGRIMDFSFKGTGDDGVAVPDPTPWYGGICGGIRSAKALKPGEPYEQEVDLNEWLRFDKPGTYTIATSSSLIRSIQGGDLYSGPVIPLTGTPLKITITPRDPQSEATRIAKDKLDLAGNQDDKRIAAIRDLRFMISPGATDILVGCLEDTQSNIVYNAEWGLRSFPDMAPVKASVLRAMEAKHYEISPANRWNYVDLLSEADMKAAGNTGKLGDWTVKTRYAKPWQDLLNSKMMTQLGSFSPAKATQVTIEGIAQAGWPREDAKNWQRIFQGIEAVTPDLQEYAASEIMLCLYGWRNEAAIKAIGQQAPALRRIAANTKMNAKLRSAAICALHATGDDSQKTIVFDDLIAPHSLLSYEAHLTIGSYRAGDVAMRLLALLKSPDQEIVNSAAGRLRDNGQAARTASLVDAYSQMGKSTAEARGALLQAIAFKDPSQALPLIRKELLLPGRGAFGSEDPAIQTACRIDTPEYASFVDGHLRSSDADVRASWAYQVVETWRAAVAPMRTDEQFRQTIHTSKHTALVHIPLLLTLIHDDPDQKVRISASSTLAEISQIPKSGVYGATEEQLTSYQPLWQAWWNTHKAELLTTANAQL